MPYKDKEREKVSAKERKLRYRARLHRERYGHDAGETASNSLPFAFSF